VCRTVPTIGRERAQLELIMHIPVVGEYLTWAWRLFTGLYRLLGGLAQVGLVRVDIWGGIEERGWEWECG
jgi:hypothetical protein